MLKITHRLKEKFLYNFMRQPYSGVLLDMEFTIGLFFLHIGTTSQKLGKHDTRTEDEIDAEFIQYLNRTDIDGWQLRKTLHTIHVSLSLRTFIPGMSGLSYFVFFTLPQVLLFSHLNTSFHNLNT